MNRHPYGGYDAPRRRSASPPYRGGYRGRGGGRPPRGRGGYAANGPDHSFDSYASQLPQDPYMPNVPPYANSGPPMNGEYPSSYGVGGVNGGPRDPYYGGGPSGPSGPNEYEDYSYSGSEYSSRGGYEGARGRGGASFRGRPRQRDDKVHDSIIEERINRERPCRTLFIRNIKYESSSDEMRAKFEEHGEIKTFFDLIKNRGMVFVTYYDLRAAEHARDKLQGMDVAGRPIDVHYSLPREHELSQRCDREKNQGTLLVTLIDSPSRQSIDDGELRRKMGQWGDIKAVKPIYLGGVMRPDQRLVEFYDSRAAVLAHDRLRDQVLQDGIMDLDFEWDIPDQPLPPGPVAIPIGSTPRSPVRPVERGPPYRGGPPNDRINDRPGGHDWDRSRPGPAPFRGDYDRGRDYPPERPDYRGDPRDRSDPRDRRGGFPPVSPIVERGGPPPYASGPRDYGRDPRDRRDDPRDRRPDDRDFDRDPRYNGPAGRPARDDWRGRASSPITRGPPPPPGTDEFGRAIPPGRADPERNESFGRAAQPNYPSFAAPPPTSPATTSSEDRYEQAKKVQELLEALKPGSRGAAAPTAAAPTPPVPTQASAPYYGASAQGPYGGAPAPTSYASQSYIKAVPSTNAYPTPTYNQGQGAPGASANPAAGMQSLLALLAQNQSQGQNPPR